MTNLKSENRCWKMQILSKKIKSETMQFRWEVEKEEKKLHRKSKDFNDRLRDEPNIFTQFFLCV
jgi:hypothetical protein